MANCRNHAMLLVVLLFCSLTGCAGKQVPVIQPGVKFHPVGMVASFSNEDWKLVLGHVVTPGGYVRWELLHKTAEREALFRYVSLIAAASPDNRPDLFSAKIDRVAYWINAYNAVCMYGVLMRNEADPTPAFFATDHFLFGGVALTLDQVENQEIKPLDEPRVVFAINRCTHSSPPLRNEPYLASAINAQLIEQGRIFLGDSRGVVRVNNVTKVNDLLATKYAPDLLAAYQVKYGKSGTLIQSLQMYAMRHSLLASAETVEPMAYDSSLNRP